MSPVWIVDPDSLVGQVWTAPYVCTMSDTLTVAGTEIHLKLTDLFTALQQS